MHAPHALKQVPCAVHVRADAQELNSTVFEGCLPADLEIVWSNLYCKTAGVTKFRMFQVACIRINSCM